MYTSKRGEVVLFVVLAIVLILGGAVAWKIGGGITGAFIGFGEESSEINQEVYVSANCGGVTACSCGDIVTSNYNLSSDLGSCSTESVLIIGADDIILDCTGRNINGSDGSTYGINISGGHNNVQIKNCNITSVPYGIIVNSTISNNLTISNVSINLFGSDIPYGIYLYNSKNTSIFNSSILFSDGALDGAGIYLNSSPYSNISNNVININIAYGIDLRTDSEYGFFYNNSVVVIDADSYGFNINSNNVTIDSNSINISLSDSFGINAWSVSSTRIINNRINILAASSYGILAGGVNVSITNNTVNVSGTASFGLSIGSNNSMVFGNLINGSVNTIGVWVQGATSSSFVNNQVFSTGGTDLFHINSTSTNNIFRNNTVNDPETGADGFELDLSSSSNYFYSNVVLAADSGFKIGGNSDTNWFQENIIYSSVDFGLTITSSNGSTFLNNNISSSMTSIQDNTPQSKINYLIYNNTFGEIRWFDNGTGSFLRGLNVSSPLTFDSSIRILNRSAGINLSSFGAADLIRYYANLSFFKLNFTTVNQVFSVGNFTNTSAEFILTNGQNCLVNNCTIINYGVNRLNLNVSYLNSIAINGTPQNLNTPPNTTYSIVNSSILSNSTLQNLNCYAQGNDSEQTRLQAEWIWYNGSYPVLAGNTTIDNGTTTLISTLDNSYTTTGENWNCSVRMYDGLDFQVDWTNTSVTIGSVICGEQVNIDFTMTEGLTECSGVGLNVTAHNINLDCDNFNINGTGQGAGIYTNASGITIKNCNINTFGNGIETTGGDSTQGSVSIFNNTISWSNATQSTSGGIVISGTSNGYSIRNNTVLHSSYAGINLNSSIGISLQGVNSFNNYLKNNTYGVKLIEQNANNFFSYEQIINNTFGVSVNVTNSANAGGTTNNTFQDSIFANNSYDVYVSPLLVVNVTIINSTTTKTKISGALGSRIYFKLYVDVNVNKSSSTGLSGVNITAYNSINGVEDTNLTDSNGFGRVIVTEYYRKGSQNFYITPSTITASLNNFTSNSTTVNLINESQVFVNFTLTEIICGSSVSSNFTFGNNYLCSDGITITGSNVVADGNGYKLSGTGTEQGVGFTILNVNGFSALNLIVENFTKGVYFENSNHSNLTGVNVINNTFGVIFNNSNNNTIYEGIISNNSLIQVFSLNGDLINNSLVNVTLNFTNTSVQGTATLFKRLHTYINVTNGAVGLPNTELKGYFNSSGNLDDSEVTNGEVSILNLAEQKKNSSGVYYLTPHNLTALFAYLGTNYTNSTSVNITSLGNQLVNLSLNLNCTIPSFSSLTDFFVNTTICPGTYIIDEVVVHDGVTITCIQTTLKSKVSANGDAVFDLYGHNIIINGCNLDASPTSYYTGISSKGIGNNFTIVNSTIIAASNGIGLSCLGCNFSFINSSVTGAATGIELVSSTVTVANITNSYFSNTVDIVMSDHTTITNSTFEGSTGLDMTDATNSRIINNTFTDQAIAIDCSSVSYAGSRNNTIYHNRFTSNVINLNQCSSMDTFNTTVSSFIQGNEWDDFCDKGTDSDSDGYADTGAATDYPYNATTSTKVSEGNATDYHPRIITCPAEDVFLGSGGSGGGSSAAGAGSGAAAASPGGAITPVKKIEPPKTVVDNSKTQVKNEKGKTIISLTLSNPTGEPLDLFAKLGASEEDFVLTTAKTTSNDDKYRIGFAPSGDSASREDLEAGLNQDKITLEPGETRELELEVDHPKLTTKSTFKVQIQGPDGSVWEKDVEITEDIVSLSAVNLHPDTNLMDVYLLIAPAAEKTGEIETYFFEFSILDTSEVSFWRDAFNLFRSERTLYTELYGPYLIPEGQGFIFDQQFRYDSSLYNGDLIVKGKIFKESEVIVENKFDVVLE